ncbi:MAG: PIN domain-containing protein, partial [Candidatus Aphodousia sp.]|nr:PIN domain-containing protein [Candidatus Aphodousia sp.]
MPLPPKPTALGSVLDLTALPTASSNSTELSESALPKTSTSKAAAKDTTRNRAKSANQTPGARPRSKSNADQPLHLEIQNEHEKRLEAKSPKLSAKTKGYRPKTRARKLFVLDTNVLMHDPLSLFQFEEHDVYLPMMTLEELDSHKKGMSDVARNARQVSRYLDQLLGHAQGNIAEGIELNALGNTEARGKLFFQTQMIESTLPQGLPQGKADNQILGVVKALQAQQADDCSVVLVSKDINMRIKATALGLAAEDYFNDKTLDDTDMLYSGRAQLPTDFWDTHGKKMQSWKEDGQTYYKITGPLVR